MSDRRADGGWSRRPERKVEVGGSESAPHLLTPSNFPFATSKTEPPRYRKCAFRRLQFELVAKMEPAVLGVWRTLSCETSGPTTRRPTLTHRGQGPSLGRLGKYPAHPLTGAQHIGRAFWAAMGGHALVGEAGSGKGGARQTCIPEEMPCTKLSITCRR